MEVWQQLLPYVGWIIAGTVAVSLGGILASVHNTRLKIKHGYPIEGMWGQSLKPGVRCRIQGTDQAAHPRERRSCAPSWARSRTG